MSSYVLNTCTRTPPRLNSRKYKLSACTQNCLSDVSAMVEQDLSQLYNLEDTWDSLRDHLIFSESTDDNFFKVDVDNLEDTDSDVKRDDLVEDPDEPESGPTPIPRADGPPVLLSLIHI